MKRRSRMDLNSIKRTILAAVGVLALSSVNAVAQEIRSEISLQGTSRSPRHTTQSTSPRQGRGRRFDKPSSFIANKLDTHRLPALQLLQYPERNRKLSAAHNRLVAWGILGR